MVTILFVLLMTVYRTSIRPDGAIELDFDIFYRVAQITRNGDLAKVYDLSQAEELSRRYPTKTAMMPYAYPPTMSLLNSSLAYVPAWLGYLVTQAIGLALFALMLPRLAGEHRGAVGVAAASAMILNVSTGQNGLVTAGLAGIAALALRRGATGTLIGTSALLALKPHLALGPPLALAIGRCWRTLALLALAGLAISAVGMLAYGVPTTRAWFDALRQSNAMLALGEQGTFPIKRMISAYAFLRFYGASHTGALVGHVLIATAAVATAVGLGWRLDPQRRFALSLTASLFITPYLYDYDAALLTVPLAIFVAEGAFDGSRRAYIAALVVVGLTPVPGALSDWKLTGGVDLVGGALGLIALYGILIAVAVRSRPGHEPEFADKDSPTHKT